MSVRLPDDKLQKCRMLLHAFLKRHSVTLKEWSQSLVSLLDFTCSVIVPGRAFLRRMIDLTGVQNAYTTAKRDIEVWLTLPLLIS